MYKLPEYLEEYREGIENVAGGNTAEEMMDRLQNDKGLAQSNIIVWVMAVQVETKIQFLEWLKKNNKLKDNV